MRIPRATVLVAVAVAVAVLVAFACTGREPGPPRAPDAFRGGSTELRVRDGLPFVETRIGERGPYALVIDSGAGHAVVSPALAREARLLPVARPSVVEPRVAVRGMRLDGGVALPAFEAIVRSTEVEAARIGRPVGAVLGGAALRGARFTLDYPRGRLRVDRGEPRRPDGGYVFHAGSAGGTPVITCVLGDRLLHPRIDTGSRAGVVLGRADADAVRFEAGPVADAVAVRRLDDPHARSGRLAETLRLGAIALERPRVFVGRATHLGSAWLRRHVVTLDLRPQASTVALEPPAVEGSRRRPERP